MKHAGSGVYGLGFIGALIYFLMHAQGAAEIIVGVFKAVFWPAVLTYNLFGFLKA